ncbi:MAG: GNAT family N-acetyltransferase [Chloroflexi bacterium]|nr:GNAT family N-acetyltransferase [Chloroflexota bacterium]
MLIEPFDPRRADERTVAAYNALMNVIRDERFPNDPPFSAADERRQMESHLAFIDVWQWGAWAGERMIGAGTALVMRDDSNRHILSGRIDILPAYRRQGMGRQLLAHIADVARAEGRRLIYLETYATVPAGEAFARRLGGGLGMTERISQLDLRAVDRGLIQTWLSAGAALAPEFALEFRAGFPDDADLPRVADVWNVMNSAPRESMDMEDEVMTPAKVRDIARSVTARGGEHWGYYARHMPTGVFAAFSETCWHPAMPAPVEQWATGVRPEFRGRGLARWLKAAMIDRIHRERPAVRYVRTENAGSNEGMLAINTALGFRPYVDRYYWHVETQGALDYLAASMAIG